MLNEIRQILAEGSQEQYIYEPDLFQRRLKEEMLRSNRSHMPFVYIEIPTKLHDVMGFEVKSSDSLTAWKIAVLTIMSNTRFIDVKGFTEDGLGILFINAHYRIIQVLRRQIARNLYEANLLHKVRLKPKRPFFRSYYFSGQMEKDVIDLNEEIELFNKDNEGFFRVEHFNYSHLAHNHWNHVVLDAAKRFSDIALTSMAMIALSPVFIVLAAMVKLSDPKGPVIFKQKRVGKNGNYFTMFKFRSMYVDAEARLKELRSQNETTGPVFKMKNDPRVFPFGRIMRKYSLDELPQLLNIIKGDMSIVGPRPPIPSEVMEYLPWHKMRLSVKPGLTCHWQVSGRSNITFDDWMRLDNQYVRHGNLKTDVELITKTFRAVFKGEGAY